ncbi:MAG: hypothetical protein MZV63_25165 [Marinilabiliales bacterium]|nr:hypothetical protein [Marinilabiliales bacterium]
MLAGLKSEGITIIVSTPYMDEALRCDRIALIQSGRILGIDTPDNIRRSYSQKLYAVSTPRQIQASPRPSLCCPRSCCPCSGRCQLPSALSPSVIPST